MKYLFYALIWGITCCVSAPIMCCVSAPHPKVVTVKHEEPRIAIQFHGDTDFSLKERALVADAIAQIEFQTAGMYRIGVVYDLDFSAMPEKWTGTAWIVRALSTYPWVPVIEFNLGGEILGANLQHEGQQPQVYLIADRLGEPAEFRHVAMHELLHAAGLKDLPGIDSVMSGATCERVPLGIQCALPTCMSVSDQAEFCRVHKCRIEQLNTCGT